MTDERRAQLRASLADQKTPAETRIDALEELGDALLADLLYQEAILLLEEALEHRPNAGRWANLADAYAKLEQPDFERRIHALLKAAELNPWWGYYYNASVAAANVGDLDRAENLAWLAWRTEKTYQAGARLVRVLRLRGTTEAAVVFALDMLDRFGEENVDVWHWVISSLLDDGKTADALEAVRKAAARFPEQYTNDLCYVLDRRANALADNDDPEGGLPFVEEMVALRPTCLNHIRAGNYHLYKRDDEERAFEHYHRCLELDSADSYAKANLGFLHSRRGEHDEGASYLSEAVAAEPKSTWRAYQYGNCLMEMLRGREAEDVAFRSVEAAGDPTDPLHLLGHIYHDFGRLDDAEAAFRASLTCRPSLLKLHRDLARVALDRDDIEAARRELEEGLSQDAESAPCLGGQIDIALRRGALADADELIARARGGHPKDVSFIVQAAESALAAGRHETSIEAAEEAVEREERSDEAWSVLGRALLGANRVPEAIEALDRSLALKVGHRPKALDAMEEALRLAKDEARADEIAARREAEIRAVAAGRTALQGFTAVPPWTAPTPQAPSKWDPMPKERSTAAVDAAILLLDQFGKDAVLRAFLEHLEPELSILEMQDRVDEIFACDPTSWGRNSLPLSANMHGLLHGERLVRELEEETSLLRQAALALTDGIPSLLPKRIVCQVEPLRSAFLFDLDEPDRYSVIEFGDCAHQFDEFDDALAGIDRCSNAQWILGSLNSLTDLPSAVRSLTSLRFASLSRNEFTRIPTALLGIETLEVLDLSRNPLRELPEDLGALRSLRYLDVVDTTLTPDQVGALREALPECHVRQFRQGKNLERFDLVHAFPGAVIDANDRVLFDPEEPLPANAGTYIMAATANLDGEVDAACVMFYASDRGGGQVWHRDSTGHWRDRTVEVHNLRPAFAVAQVARAEDPRKTDYRNEFRREGTLPQPSPELASKWVAALGAEARAGLGPRSCLACEEWTGATIPPQLGACLEAADGGGQFLSAEDILREWLNWKQIYDDFDFEDLMGEDWESHEGKTVPAYWVPEWLPFYDAGGGNFLAIDGLPNERGKHGQIIAFGADETRIRCVADDLEDFLDRLLADEDPQNAGFDPA